ncbi:MAG TPA: hypothetical protein VGC37_14830, partial [Friedmanniella sp.]
PPAELSTEELAELAADDPESDDPESDNPSGAAEPEDAAPADDATSTDEPTLVARRDEAAEPTIAVVRHLTRLSVEVDSVEVGGEIGADALSHVGEAEARSALDTLYDMLGGYAEESPRVYAGLSDATAVPVVDEHEFEPAADVLVPAEPDPETPEPDADDAPVQPGPDGQAEATRPEATPDEPSAVDEPEPLIPSPGASRKPGRRKRAAVPSWDEIMFGGPKPG